MFPAGAAGWGLLLLRVCAAAMLVRNSIANTNLSIPIWETAGVGVIVAAFCLGAFTPVSCSLSALMQAFLAMHADPFEFAVSLCLTASFFLLGPGAYSLDSHLFGRRLIVHSDSK